MKKIKLTDHQYKLLLNELVIYTSCNDKKVITEFTDDILDRIKDFNEDIRLNKFNNFEKQIFFYQKGFGYIDKRFLKYVNDFRKYYFQTNNQTTRHLSNEEIVRFLTKHYYIDIKPNIDDEDIIFKDDENTKSPFPKFDLIWMSNLKSINRDFNNPDIHSESVKSKRKILYNAIVLDKENREKKIKEEKSGADPHNLDTPINRKLLNIISKHNDLGKIIRSTHRSIIDQLTGIIQFIKNTLFIEDNIIMSQLLWLIFINGDINYLKDPISTSTDFQLYIIWWYGEIDESWDEREESCDECDGYGTQDEECNMCSGTGEEETGDTDKEGQPIMVECPDCDGTGEVSNDCIQCGGSGYQLEDFTKYVVELWHSAFISLDKNIEAPPTIMHPYSAITSKGAQPFNFEQWLEEQNQQSLILIWDDIEDELSVEEKTDVEDEAENIEHFTSQSLDHFGFSAFIKQYM